MKKTLFLLILISFLFPASGVAGEAGAVVTLLDGSAELFTAGAAQGRPLAKGEQVVKDSEIRVGANSRIELRLPDGSFIRLAQNTRITVNQLEFDGAAARKDYRIDLRLGKLWAKVKKLLTPDSAVAVHTVTMTVGVRGTAFGMDVKGDNSGQVKVYEGEVSAVAAAPAAKQTILKAGEQLVVSKRGVFSKPKPFDPKAETDEWSRWNHERDRLAEQEPEPSASGGAGSPPAAATAAA